MTTITLPKMSIIIPTYKRPHSLHRLLKLIGMQNHTDFDDIEIVVVNDGSGDDVYDELNESEYDKYPFDYLYLVTDRLPGDVPNVQEVINFGVRISTNPLLLILDDGLIIDTHVIFIHRLYHALLGAGVSLWPYECPVEKNPYHSDACEQAPRVIREATGPMIDVWITMGGNSIDRESWEAIDGLDLVYTGNVGADDRDFAIRLYKAGVRIIQADGITRVNSDEETGGSWTAKLAPIGGHINEGIFLDRWPEYEGWHWGEKSS